MQDVFYREELSLLEKAYPNFCTHYYLSREDNPGYERGYVTDTITETLTGVYKEYYLCGSPAMVKDARARLSEAGVEPGQIRFEQY
ncbi:MAG TPA: hypothetical protein PK765_02840 [bacterium]|nr:hypothetical protein [bacterium]